jgi:hypothetical protein
MKQGFVQGSKKQLAKVHGYEKIFKQFAESLVYIAAPTVGWPDADRHCARIKS